MKRILLALAAIFMLSSLSVKADMFSSTPTPLQESSKNVVITFDALQSGVAGLQNLSTDLYAHIGVYTNLSPNTWAHTSTWKDNAAKYCLKRVAANKYELEIGDIRTYFGITNANETVTKICIIARTADGSVQTSDQFVDVYPDGLYVALSTNPSNTTITKATEITFTASATKSSEIKMYVDNKEVKSASNATTLTYSQNFSTPGQQNIVKVVATSGSEKSETSVTVFYVKASEQQNYPGGVPKQGAVKNADGTVTFCLAAPGKSSVILVGSWDDYNVLGDNTMKYQDYQGYRYFWTTVSGLDNSTYYPYYYLVDGKYKVGDPYAHLVLDHISDKWLDEDVFPDRPLYPYSKFDDTLLGVYKGDLQTTYKWRNNNFKITDPNALVIYEMCLRDFTGTSETADGTLRLAIDKIDYLVQLGITAVELMPIMEFDGNNSWGYNTNSYMALDKAYGSPDDLKEFVDLCHGKGIAVILDIVFNHTPGLHPWYAMYDEKTSPFYNATAPHDYSVYEDLKQDYPLVEKHWEDVLTHWLTNYKVDGFRFDLVKGLGDSDSYKSGTEAYNKTRVERMKRLHAIIKKVNPYAIHINENLAGKQEETEMGNDGQYQWNNQNGTASSFVSSGGGNLKYLNSEQCGRPACSTIDYMVSHDEPWLVGKSSSGNITKNNAKALASAASQLFLSPGPKMIWQFDELGYNGNLTDANRTDPKPMPTEEWYTNEYRCAVNDSYKALIWLRKLNPEMFDKDATIVYNDFKDNTAGPRTLRLTKGNKEIIAFINSASATKTVTVTSSRLTKENSVLITESMDNTGKLDGTGTSLSIKLPSRSFAVYATTDVSGVDEVIADEIGNNNFKVVGGEGEIIISGDYTNATVYNLSGIMMPSLKVAPGMYIVNVDGQATKVIVR